MDTGTPPLIACNLRNVARGKRVDHGLTSESSGELTAGPTKVSVNSPIKTRSSIVRASGMGKT